MKRIWKVILCMMMFMSLCGCGNSKPDYEKVFNKMKEDGYRFEYNYSEMEGKNGDYRIYVLTIMPKSFTLRDSSYLYFNAVKDQDETKVDSIFATAYHVEDGEIFGVSTADEKQIIMNGTCFVDYDTLEQKEGTVGSCEDGQIEVMKGQKEKIASFLKELGLKYQDLVGFYEWYASNYEDTAVKNEK